MFLFEGILNIIFIMIFLMIEWRFWVLVLCLIVFFVIVFNVLGLNLSLVLFRERSFWYCLINVFFGLVKICIRLFVVNFFKVVIIGNCLINLGINLNFSKFLGMICCMMFLFLESFWFCVLNLIVFLFIWFFMIVLILLNVLFMMNKIFVVLIWINFWCGCLCFFWGGIFVIVFFRIFSKVCWIFLLEILWVMDIFLFLCVILLILLI